MKLGDYLTAINYSKETLLDTEDEIIEKNKDLISKGVKFIIPFPEVKVVGA